jgi:hypothetical protein
MNKVEREALVGVVRLARTVRESQRKFNRSRSPHDLGVALDWESRLDRSLAALPEEFEVSDVV